MKKKVMVITLAALLFLLALGFTLYPLIANRYHQRHQSEIHTAYQEQIAQADNTEIIAAREAAIAYNETLLSGVQTEDAFSNEALNRKEADNLCKRVKRSRLSREAYLRHALLEAFLENYFEGSASILGASLSRIKK